MVAETPLLQTDRADTGRIIESKQITEIPLGFNRNFQGLLVTVPGATRPFRPHSQFFNSQDSLSTNVNGQSRLANNVMLDGIDNNHKTGLLTVVIPSADAIEAVSVSTSNYDAEFGRAGGAVTNVTLKSGTNQLKGVAFFFGNGNSTLAKDYFSGHEGRHQLQAVRGRPRRPDRQEQALLLRRLPGHARQPRATSSATTSRPRTSATATSAGRPRSSTTPRPATRTARGGSRSPATSFPPTGSAPSPATSSPSCPRPNVAAALGQNNYEFPSVREKKTEAADLKLTYQASVAGQPGLPVQLPAARGVRSRARSAIYGGPSNGGFAGTGTNKTFSTALNWTRTLRLDRDPRRARGVRLLPQRGAGPGSGAQHLGRGRHPRREPRRVHERAHPDRDPAGLLEPGARLLGQPALGPLREDVQRGLHLHQAEGQPHDEGGVRRPPQPRLPAPGPGQRRIARALPVQRRPDRVAHRHRLPERLRQRDGELPAGPPLERRARPGGRPIPAPSTGRSSPSSTTSGRSRPS